MAATSRRGWSCTATCNLQAIGDTVLSAQRVEGTGVGNTEAEACRSAKRAATQAAPAGSYPRHCKYRCGER